MQCSGYTEKDLYILHFYWSKILWIYKITIVYDYNMMSKQLLDNKMTMEKTMQQTMQQTINQTIDRLWNNLWDRLWNRLLNRSWNRL